MIGLILFMTAPGTAFRRAAVPQLKERLPDTWPQIWQASRAWQSRLAPSRPRRGLVLNMVMRQMEWNCALYRALTDHGMAQEEACVLVEAIGSAVYRPLADTWFQTSRLRSAEHATRVKWLFKMMTRYFFSPPFVHRHLRPEPGEVVAFDVTRCPLAAYFENQGVPELTQHAACRLDFAVAHAYRVDLVRTQTIADGHGYCDFRWKLPDKVADSAES